MSLPLFQVRELSLGGITCLRSHSMEMLEPGFEPRSVVI